MKDYISNSRKKAGIHFPNDEKVKHLLFLADLKKVWTWA